MYDPNTTQTAPAGSQVSNDTLHFPRPKTALCLLKGAGYSFLQYFPPLRTPSRLI